MGSVGKGNGEGKDGCVHATPPPTLRERTETYTPSGVKKCCAPRWGMAGAAGAPDQVCCLDLSRLPLEVLQLPAERRAAALIRLVRTANVNAIPASFVVGTTPMSPLAEAATVIFFGGGALVLATLTAWVVGVCLLGTWPLLLATFATLAALSYHPLPVGSEALLRSRLLLLLFRYFSFKICWRGAVDVRERDKASGGPSLAFGSEPRPNRTRAARRW